MPKNRFAASRRGFLISAGAAGIGAAAAVVSAVQPESGSEPAAQTAKAKSGYRVSEHINKYYRTTRV